MPTERKPAAGGPSGGDKARKQCELLLRASGMLRRRVAFGRTKLFLDGPVYEELLLARRALHSGYATSLQRCGRGMLSRGRVRRERARRAEEERRRLRVRVRVSRNPSPSPNPTQERRRLAEEAALRRRIAAEEARLREEARVRKAAEDAAAEARLEEEDPQPLPLPPPTPDP